MPPTSARPQLWNPMFLAEFLSAGRKTKKSAGKNVVAFSLNLTWHTRQRLDSQAFVDFLFPTE
jgi:hypothetical protein